MRDKLKVFTTLGILVLSPVLVANRINSQLYAKRMAIWFFVVVTRI